MRQAPSVSDLIYAENFSGRREIPQCPSRHHEDLRPHESQQYLKVLYG